MALQVFSLNMFNRKLTYRAPLKGCQKSHAQSDQLLVQCCKMS